jgi:putative nucleotidyltransferase with HDIG domain
MKEFGRILLVIDNLADLAAVTPLFTELPEAWKVNVSQSPKDALCQMAQVHFDIVFVDLQDGPVASTQFLHEVWARYPDTIRFLLANSLEMDLMVMCALGPHQFLQKPLEGATIRSAIERAHLVHRLFKEKNVQTLVSRIRTFPSRPTVYVEVMRELRSMNASPETVGELVSRDLAISIKLLQITNSAFFGFQRQVSTPSDAVMLLGMQTTSSLVLGIEAFAKLDNVKLLYFSTDQIWKHSQAVAHSAKAIAELMTNDSALAHDAYTAALLHDIGKLALAVNLEEQYRQALDTAQQKNVPLFEVELEVFGATHAEAGAYLLSLWGLPARVVEAVATHHLPARDLPKKFSPLTAVHIANALEYAEASGRSGFPEFRLDLEYPDELRIQENIEQMRDIVRATVRPAPDLTQFIRRTPLQQNSPARAASQSVSDSAPNGWWARFRDLLAA